MDIKSKKMSLSLGAKSLSFMLLGVAWLGILFGIGYLTYYFNYSNGALNNETAYAYYNLVHNVTEKVAVLESEANIQLNGQSEKVSKEEIRVRIERFKTIEQHLLDHPNFGYWIENTETGEVITNLGSDGLEVIKKQPTYYSSSISENTTSDYYLVYGDDVIRNMLRNTPYWINTAIIQPPVEGDIFYDLLKKDQSFRGWMNYIIGLMIFSVLIGFFSLVHLIASAGKSPVMEAPQLNIFDKVYFEVQSVFVILAIAMTIELLRSVGNPDVLEILIVIILAGGAFYLLCMPVFLSVVRRLKVGQFWRGFLFVIIIQKMNDAFKSLWNGKMFKPIALGMLLAYGFGNGICFLLMQNAPGMLFIWLGVNTAALYILYRYLQSITVIRDATAAIASGNLNYPMNVTKLASPFVGMGKHIEDIQFGLENALEEALKGERMKTALITNVSHDLKTPLTSIINYVDLLKSEENPEIAKEYIDVLDEKSQRLKILIENLMEASKASSGNLKVTMETLDWHQLIQQALGEFNTSFTEMNLDIRLSDTEKPMKVQGDGQHLWRVTENLFSNIKKYAMPNTRVYIQLQEDDTHVTLVLKNTSNHSLDILPEQLMERFVRGDSARTTEGSGLGLSIASSLIHLQKGTFEIVIDGDLFKVIVKLKKGY